MHRRQIMVVKLLDYEAQWGTLEQSTNPFAVLVIAHLKVQVTRRDPRGWLHWKLTLVKMLYERGYSRQDVLELFRFVDWLLVLPRELERGFREALVQYEEEKKMPYITSIERMEIQQKAREDVLEILDVRFEGVPQLLVEIIGGIEDLSLLNRLLKKAATAGSLKEIQQVLEESQHRE